MTTDPGRFRWGAHRRSLLVSLVWVGVVGLTLNPAPLAPIARLYHALCALFPVLSIPGQIIPSLALGLLLLLLGLSSLAACVAGLRDLKETRRIQRMLHRCSALPPARLTAVSRPLLREDRLTYLVASTPVALCYGLLRPRIAISAGLLSRLDDVELAAVLLHERHHLRHRDPLRFFLLHVLASGLFLAPLAPTAQRWLETRIELAADRAALAQLPRAALAGALAALLTAPVPRPAGLAALSATESRIAYLVGSPHRTPFPVTPALLSGALLVGLSLALSWLARSYDVWEIICALCPRLT